MPRVSGKGAARLWLICLLSVLPWTGGCGWVYRMLGTENGYLLQADDVLALPGEQVILRARLKTGWWLGEVGDRPVTFILEGKPFANVKTDDEGWAEVAFRPQAPRDYVFTIEAAPDRSGEKPQATDLLAACRSADAPILVTDVDNTVVVSESKSGFVKNRTPPVPHAAEALTRLARHYTVVYVTFRPEPLTFRSKKWLEENGFPRGLVFLSRFKKIAENREQFKQDRIQDLRRKFHRVEVGIGNADTDMHAYLENAMRAIAIVHLTRPDDPKYLRQRAKRLELMPDAAEAYLDWRQIGEAILKGTRTPKRTVQDELNRRADQLRPGR